MAGNFDTSGTQSSHTKITLSPGQQAYSVWILFTFKDDMKSFVNERPLHNKSQTNLFGSLNVYTWAAFSLRFSFSCCYYPHISCQRWLDGLSVLQCLGLTSILLQNSPQHSSSLSAQRFGASSHCDGQLEVLFILIHLSFSISTLDWSLKAKAAQIVPT